MKALQAIKKHSLLKKTWTHKGFHGVLHYFFVVGEQPLRTLQEFYGDSHKISVFFFHDNYGEWYWNNEDMVRLRKSFIKKVHKNPKILEKHLNEWHKRVDKFNICMRKIDKTDLSKLSNNALLKLYNEWYQLYLAEYGIAIGIQDAFSMHAEDFLAPHFKEIIEEQGEGIHFNEYYTLLMNPIDDSFFTKEYRDRLKLLKAKNNKLDPKKQEVLLAKHVKKYHWIHNNYVKDVYLDKEYFIEELKKIEHFDPDRENERLDRQLKEIKKRKTVLIKKLKLSKESKNLIKITEVFAYMQDERKKYVLIASHYQNLFITEFGKRLKLTKEEMKYTYIHELETLLKQKKIDKKIFKERKKFVCVISTVNNYDILQGKEAEQLFRTCFEKKQEKVDIIKGMVASTGYAKGPVKIIRKTHDIINFQEGDILVASMTRPETIVAMEKAAAIVTDEGGVTCHAAVVSREMGKPCIIATKIATKVLEDGDIVEVDAEKGIIRKL
jgi:phosphoenolpyruvate synthase/pyruvate phosphate dikinase